MTFYWAVIDKLMTRRQQAGCNFGKIGSSIDQEDCSRGPKVDKEKKIAPKLSKGCSKWNKEVISLKNKEKPMDLKLSTLKMSFLAVVQV